MFDCIHLERVLIDTSQIIDVENSVSVEYVLTTIIFAMLEKVSLGKGFEGNFNNSYIEFDENSI